MSALGPGLDVDSRVRRGTAGDLEAMYRLDVECFDAPFRFSRAAMRRFAQAAGAFSLVAKSADVTLAGFIVIQMGEVRGSREGYVVTLDVAAQHRRQGVARMLLQTAEQEVAAVGGRSITLHVWTKNEAAIKFYEGCDYERTLLHSAFYDSERDAYGYRKNVPAYREALSQKA